MALRVAFAPEQQISAALKAKGGQFARIRLLSPLSGVVKPLTAHPLPLFNRGGLGQGVVIEVTEHKMYAPFTGKVKHIEEGGRLWTLVSDSGLKVLVHFAIDDNAMPLIGLKYYVRVGEHIEAGQVLMYVDLRQFTQRIHAAVSIINHHPIVRLFYTQHLVKAGKDPLLTCLISRKS